MADHVRSDKLALDGRWCPSCKTVKLSDAFYTNADGKPIGYCKVCKLAKLKEARNKPENRQRALNYQREYWKEVRADPVALEAYREKKRKDRDNDEYRERNRQYQREHRRKKLQSATL